MRAVVPLHLILLMMPLGWAAYKLAIDTDLLWISRLPLLGSMVILLGFGFASIVAYVRGHPWAPCLAMPPLVFWAFGFVAMALLGICEDDDRSLWLACIGAGIYCALLVALAWLDARTLSPRTAMKTIAIAVSVLLFIAGALVIAIVQPGRSGVVASLRLPDGSEYMVTQRCNWSPEPYTVSFYMRSPGGKWGWCYIDHQANRWRRVSMAYDTTSDVVTVTERGTWRAALNRKRSTFAIGDGRPWRELVAPQEDRDPEFPFP